MYRIDNANAVAVMPTPAAPGVNPNGYFYKGNPSIGQEATIVDDDWLNATQEEICYVIEQTGGTLSKTNRHQLYDAIVSLIQGIPYAASASAANTYTATVSPAIVSYTVGKVYAIKFANGNTGSATLNLNGVGAVMMTRKDGNALSAGDIFPNMIGLVSYDGTYIQVLNVNDQRAPYATSTSSPNTYTCTITPAPTAWVTGMSFAVKFTNANTGAATINPNGLGAKNIVPRGGTQLLAKQITGGMIGYFYYDGTNVQLQNPETIAPTATSLSGAGTTGTYNTPTGCKFIKVWVLGAGGGGAATGGLSAVNGTAGTATTFGGMTANGGAGGTNSGGAGGTASGGTLNYSGQAGSAGVGVNASISQDVGMLGGAGGNAPFLVHGGAFHSALGGSTYTGANATANSGGGGSGGSWSSSIGAASTGGGGGGGGGCYALLPAGSYSYGIGTKGAGGANGIYTGGNGADGFIFIEEYY